MRATDATGLWRWTQRLTRVWMVAFSLTVGAGVLYMLGLQTAAGLAVWLGCMGLLFMTWALMMLSAMREYLAGQWPVLDLKRWYSEAGNPAIYQYFGRVLRGMFRW